MSNGMGRPMHSILGLLSVMQEENLKREQKLVVDSMFRTNTVMSNLLNDAMDWSSRDGGRFPLEMKPFGLHAMVKDAPCFQKSQRHHEHHREMKLLASSPLSRNTSSQPAKPETQKAPNLFALETLNCDFTHLPN
ncbi:hypothetical protein LR48_Vigan404s000400 [Vigna angularis]|uniref:Uncharacterized protein n=1 Tax=Phaseolus angularis TaxID=3914 RepID=A0A0L9T9A0_PHAAN|nr:hypothetical protein LR48_Vigan404s000400 [Vigna angularis]